MIINHNIAALNTHRQLSTNTANTNKNIEKLSSGLRINRAGDDAAGLAISEKMRGQIRGLDQATRNAQDGISLIQTAEGALNETHSILQRMRELSVQSSNDTNTTQDRAELQKEMNQLTSEINRIGNTTEFNTKKLLNGDLSSESATGATKSTTVISNVAKHDMSFAFGVATTGTNTKLTGNKIDIAATDGNAFNYGTATAGELTIEKGTDGNVKVSLVGGDDGTNKLDFSDENATLKDGVYTYNSHGISFSMSEADVKAMATGDKVVVDFAARAAATPAVSNTGTIGVGSDYKAGATLANNTNVIKDFTVDATKLDPKAAKIDLKMDAGELTLTVSDKDGNALNTLTTKDLADGDTFSEYGISFKLDGLDAADSFELNTINLDTKTTTVAVTEDKSASFQIGANQNQSLSLGVNDMRAGALGITGSGAGFSAAANVTDGTDNTNVESALDITSSANAANAITVVDRAISSVSSERSKLGAVQNRLEHTINNLGTSSENLTAAESRIRDVDMAKEMMSQTKNNILAQAAQAMLAQANQQPQGVLQLLR
ncbi:flagellin [Paenibacillus xylanexedens]|uniref:flagellin N-terminal helical domain-containing protein n=1 Tax=Paenibacillus xylanexedens TaxID=528191 RepID=UPI0028ED7495|nr:flagellin [Paenibacillus xylanexedens]